MGINSCGTTLIDNGTFQNIGSVTWDTTAKTSGFTGVSGNGYFVNTTSGAITVTLPSSPSAGDVIGIKDYASTADTNNITIGRNGSNINGDAADYIMNIEGLSVLLVYVDGTKGWLVTNSAQASDLASPFIEATGGTITTSGDFKIHTFTGPGTFCVSNAGGPAGSDTVDYMVVAGGGGAGFNNAGGGGGGGFRASSGAASGCYSASPLASGVSALPVSIQSYPITVGSGGSGVTSGRGTNGSNSIFSTITSTGGGVGGSGEVSTPGSPGGSGGGGAYPGSNPGGSGNTPPVSPPQGSNGGNGAPLGGAGGGGATSAGANGSGADGGPGGTGATSSITTSPVGYSGGGGGGADNATGGSASPCGSGGAGSPYAPIAGGAGATNRGGGGGGGGGATSPSTGGNGGSGVVVIRYKYQ